MKRDDAGRWLPLEVTQPVRSSAGKAHAINASRPRTDLPIGFREPCI
jgi:hypothetical protein